MGEQPDAGGTGGVDDADARPALSDAELAERHVALGERLAAQRARNPLPGADLRPTGSMKGMAEGLKLASEFIAGVLVGAGIGYVVDKLAGTGPFGLIVFLILGFAAGVLNVLRSVSPKTVGAPPRASSSVPPDDPSPPAGR